MTLDEGGSASEHGFVALASRARWAVVALVVTGLVDIVAIVLDWDRLDLLGRIDSGEFTLNEAAASDHRQAVMGVVQLCVLVVTAVVFLRWFRRAYLNVDALGGRRRFSTRWAIGGWFVPILNFWRPKQIANDLWHTSVAAAPLEGEPAEGLSPLLTVWWVTFLASSWISARGAAASAGETIDDLTRATTYYLIGDITDLVAVPLAIAVVLLLTARQARRAQHRAEIASGIPAGPAAST